MNEALSAYWWIIIPLALAILALIFSLEKRGGKDKKLFPQNYVDGLRAIIAGDEKTAFVKLKQAVADDTDNVDAYLKLGDLFRKKGLLDKAVQVHRELVLRRNTDAGTMALVYQSLALDYIEAKKYEQALEILEKLNKDSSFRNWAQEKMREIYEKTGQWEKAFDIGKGILKAKDRTYELAVYRHLAGDELFNEGEFHKARLAYKDALHYDDKFAQSYIMIAESYLAEGRKQDAAEFFKKLVHKVPSEAYQVIHRIEETLFDLGHFSDIEAIYREILQACPDDAVILKALAGIDEKKGDIRSAIDTLAPVLSKDDREATSVAKLAQLYLADGRQREAMEILDTLQSDRQSGRRQYKCPHCNNVSFKQEIICPNCRRAGPYKRI
jgi:lipopolysaccharide biosynthesis regulator YciM